MDTSGNIGAPGLEQDPGKIASTEGLRSDAELRRGMEAAGVPPESIDMLLLHRAQQIREDPSRIRKHPDLAAKGNAVSTSEFSLETLEQGFTLQVKCEEEFNYHAFSPTSASTLPSASMAFIVRSDKSLKHMKLHHRVAGDETKDEDAGECLFHHHLSKEMEVRFPWDGAYRKIGKNGVEWQSKSIKNGTALRWATEHYGLEPNFVIRCYSAVGSDVLVECHIDKDKEEAGYIEVPAAVVSDLKGLSELLLLSFAFTCRTSQDIEKIRRKSGWSGTDDSNTSAVSAVVGANAAVAAYVGT